MNFRDVLKALALYPGEAPDARTFGDEVSGVVIAVGAGVKHVAPGDRVFGLAVFGLATRTLARGGDVRLIPGKLSFEEAATLPVVFMTSWHALKNVARLRAGERILVHAGAGGVGMAAIQLCRAAGAEVIGTASASKHAVLREAGVAHCIDYRSEDFEAATKRLTNGRGVDVVLDATGKFSKSYRVLAPLGRLVCFGLSSASSGMEPSRISALWAVARLPWFHPIKLMNDNRAVIGVNLGHLWDHMDMLRREMTGLIADVEAGRLKPVVDRTFPLADAAGAHRFMQERRNVGKVLLAP
jgi:NADPH:quinone reductase-like Zn-dependent oxidoreductase